MSLYDYGLGTLAQYELTADRSARTRGALLCYTAQGLLILREFHGSEKKLEKQQAWHYALAGGDDYELCFTISPQNFEKLSRQQLDVPLTIIGKITQQTGLLFEYMGENCPLQIHGYQHFA